MCVLSHRTAHGQEGQIRGWLVRSSQMWGVGSRSPLLDEAGVIIKGRLDPSDALQMLTEEGVDAWGLCMIGGEMDGGTYWHSAQPRGSWNRWR